MYFNDFFSQQCKPIINSVLPVQNVLTDRRIGHITIQSNDVINSEYKL